MITFSQTGTQSSTSDYKPISVGSNAFVFLLRRNNGNLNFFSCLLAKKNGGQTVM